MSCLNCASRANCKKICPEVELLLPRPYGGINGKKIKFYDPLILESMANTEVFKLKFGGRKQPNIED